MERIAVMDGLRTPFCKAGGKLKDLEADDLGAFAIKELVLRMEVDPAIIDEVIIGNVLQPPHATNIARVISVKGGIPEKVPAFTVNRNCSSGMESASLAYQKLQLDLAKVLIAGGVESMSNFPVLVSKPFREWLTAFSKAKSLKDRFRLFLRFRLGFLKPNIPEIRDPLCSLSMGDTAEILSKEFLVTRKEQDEFGFLSQSRAEKAQKTGIFKEEIVSIPLPPQFNTMCGLDDGIREGQTLDDFAKLKPVFNRLTGTVTAGTSSQVTDGGAMLLLCRESAIKSFGGKKPLGFIRAFTQVALDPKKMGLGPAYAIAKLLDENHLTLEDIDLFEINEAFAAQVLAVLKALSSLDFAKKELGKEREVGRIDLEKLNVNGGAIALGHPLGASGTRLILTLLKELKRRNKKRGLASLCVGGGQGEACIVEVE